MINNKTIDAAKTTGIAYKLADADGLYLQVSAAGTKSWRYNHVKNGKQQTKTYGQYPTLGISAARKIHNDYKYVTSITPIQITFFEAAQKWLAVHLPSLKNTKHQLQIGSTLKQFVYPAVGAMAVGDIKRRDIVAIVQAVAARGTLETAHRVAGRIKQVFDYAVDLGELEHNPATGLTRVLKPTQPKPMSAVAWHLMPKLMQDIASYQEPVTQLGLKLLAHTFVRTRELTQAKWAEFDLQKAIWVIPEERMKLGKPHVVPLSVPVLNMLTELQFHGCGEYILESSIRRGRPISENTLLFALYRLGYRGIMTGHGFRAVASTQLNECGLWSIDAIERQLAHKETDAVRAAYHRAEYLEERIKLMSWYSAQLVALSA